MSHLTIREHFSLAAAPDEVWSLLTDPERVVSCLPGAELTGVEGDDTYAGAVKVKVGSVTVAYRGTAVFEEIDPERRFVRIVGRGRERSGSGTASMTMESRVEESPEGGATVTVDAEIKLTGKMVRFGRGMIQSVSSEIFREFTERFARRVEEARPIEPEANTSAATRPPAPPADEANREESEPPTSPADAASLPLLPLLWRAFRRWLRGLFG